MKTYAEVRDMPFWPRLLTCWWASLTCLLDAELYAEIGNRLYDLAVLLTMLCAKILATVLTPFTGLLIMFAMHHYRKKEAKARKELEEHYGLKRQKL